MKTFFISDTHFYHKNIIKYTNRPFVTVEEMNAELIRRWNDVVSPEDRVIHGGDFSFGTQYHITDTLSKLNGEKHLILGNHDKTARVMVECGFASAQMYWTEDGILVFHRPEAVPKNLYDDCNIFLYGHIHNNVLQIPKGINICVEHLNFTPTELEKLL